MLEKIKGKLVVSCQAYPGEPLFECMDKMALSAKMGGAAAIRAQGVHDIEAIKKAVDLPVIGLIKETYENSPVYITPTQKEVEALLNTSCEMIALDMTMRRRPDGEKLLTLVKLIKSEGRLVLGDISTLEEGIMAEEFGADAVSTTLSGYTAYSSQIETPDVELVKNLVREVKIPVLAEGRIATREQLQEVMEAGAYSAVIGGAITRPHAITESFVKAMNECAKA